MLNLKLNTLYRKFLPVLLLPFLFGITQFGWRAAVLCLCGLLGSLIGARLLRGQTGGRIEQSFWITGLLCSFSLPVHTPLWAVLLASFFAQFMGKMVFGGFGNNPFNPALTGRVFITLCIPGFFAANWPIPAKELAGYMAWTADSVTGATPLMKFRATGLLPSFNEGLLGFTGGSICETPALLLFLLLVYMTIRKIGNTVFSFSFLAALAIGGWAGSLLWPGVVLPGHLQLVTGGAMAGALFFCTDPVTSPRTRRGRILGGILLAVLLLIIRSRSTFPEGFMFAMLLVNSFTSFLESGRSSQ